MQMLKDELDKIRSYHSRKCSSLPDLDLIVNGVLRVCSPVVSGRDFLQYIDDSGITKIPRATFFDALSSKRRRLVVRDYSRQLYEHLNLKLAELKVNYLESFPELEDFNVISGDGHFIQHPSHGQRHPVKDRHYAVGNIFVQNLRTGLMYPLAAINDGSEKKHEMPIFRKAADFKEKTICVLDRAYIDNNFWTQQHRKYKVSFISRKKESHAPMTCGEFLFDKNDPVNDGVVSDKLVAFSNGQTLMRLIEYQDPETNEKYEFITSLTETLFRPGLICHLYFLRWQIEKSYDIFKNSFGETKAWATSKSALEMHSHFITMHYNFLRYLQEIFKDEVGIGDKKCEDKYKARLEKRDKTARKKGCHLRALLKLPIRLARMSSQFIRFVRNYFLQLIPLQQLYQLYRTRMQAYL